jgi:hypothetical protein
MSKTESDKIILRKVSDDLIESALLSEIASPGHLVELLSTANDTIQKNDSGFSQGIGILLENETLTGTKETAYASGDTAQYSNLVAGMIVQVRVAAGATAITKGDRLTVVTGGTVGKLTAQADLTAATGTASDTIADVTGTPTQTLINNNFKSVAEKINALIPGSLGFIGIALESKDNSGGGSEVFIQMKVA